MSLRDRLGARRPPSLVFRLRTDWSAEADAAHERMHRAKAAFQMAVLAGSDDRADAARAELDEAAAACDQFCESLRLVAMPPAHYEALIAAHPPTEAQRKDDARALWNPSTFEDALLAATVIPDDGEDPMTADEWTALAKTASLSLGERAQLVLACQQVNDRTADVRLGKGA